MLLMSESVIKKTILALSLFVLLSCTQNIRSFLSPEEMLWLKDHEGEIEVLFGYELPPDAFTNSLGEYTGLLVDYLHELESILGFHFPMKIFSTWHELLEYSKTGRNYIIVGLSYTDQRDLFLDFTTPFQDNAFSIISRRDHPVETVEEFLQVSHCTVKGYAIDDYLDRDYPGYTTSHVLTDIEGIIAVSEGEYDAMFSAEIYANYLIGREGIKNLIVTGGTGYYYRYSMAVSEGDDILLSILQKGQDRISTRRHKEINRHWNTAFTRNISSDTWNILFFSILGLLIAVLIVMIWVLTLRAEVKKKTVELREKGVRYKSLAESWDLIFQSMAAGVLLTDSEGRIINANPAMEKLCGRSVDELKGKSDPQDVFQFQKEADAERIRNIHIKVRENRDSFELRNTFPVKSYDGKERLITVMVTPYGRVGPEQAGATWIVRDVGDYIRREREILEADKLESLKLLAGGISHDFNNLLTGIYGFVNLATISLAEPAKAEEFLDKAVSSLDDARSLTSQLATLAKGGRDDKTVFNPSSYIRETAEFSHRSGGPRLIIDVPDDLWTIQADKGQLGQVIGNLVINAQQALGASGEIRISGKNLIEDSEHYVEILFSDNGPGIPPEIRSRIFDPYFTTKKEGSGLGLASCFSIVSRHNGTLTVDSEPGKTVFCVRLPAEQN